MKWAIASPKRRGGCTEAQECGHGEGGGLTNVRDFEMEMNRMRISPCTSWLTRIMTWRWRVDLKTPRSSLLTERSKAGKTYDEVERWHGNRRPNTMERA